MAYTKNFYRKRFLKDFRRTFFCFYKFFQKFSKNDVKNGYENIIVHTVNYINDQIDLMRQLIHYVEENPTPKLLVSASEIVEKKEQTEIPAAENMPPADGLETVSAEAI